MLHIIIVCQKLDSVFNKGYEKACSYHTITINIQQFF